MFHPTPLHSVHNFKSTIPICPTKTLVLEDSLFDQRRLERIVRDGALSLTLNFVNTIADLRTRLEQTRFDIVFLDYRLPVGSGSDAFDLVRTNEMNGDCTIILLAGQDGLDRCGQRLRQNCDYHLNKADLTPDLLRTAVFDIQSGLIPRKPVSIF